MEVQKAKGGVSHGGGSAGRREGCGSKVSRCGADTEALLVPVTLRVVGPFFDTRPFHLGFRRDDRYRCLSTLFPRSVLVLRHRD